MALFQTSVLNKYLAEQDAQLVHNQYVVFKNYFLNTTIQQNIIASKEEEFQEGFLRELFVNVLGYTINPEPDFNLITELKNEKDSKKADGAIIDDDKILAVIELKSTKTTDFNKIEIQAFGYKNNQANCKYVITSNFQKLRFYIDNAIEFLEWDLFKLDFESFKLMYLCLHKEAIFNNIPATIKTESITVEENVTKQLYKEYSQFRKSLFNNIVELNPTINKLVVFKKTQKLLDRFLFLFFAEDRMLVPPNSVRIILEQWTHLKEMDAYQPLYDRFKLYFGYLNTGHKGKLHDIFAYNGGLFATDEILDSIKMDDSILYNATLGLSNYDYNSEVDVNILGHIFEHSLTEIEELEKEITAPSLLEAAGVRSKRKKDGVFYTPKYITKYIVENTVGTLCKNKKEELNLQEEDYHKLTKKAKKEIYATLQNYKEWLLQITIIDPACGSGAFLNQALEFLIAEHKWISELEANVTGASIVFDVETSILENNIFGVDINEESVEIAKLSLWLRTAKKGRKLNSLNNNIKCGNSLIDDPAVAGDKAFNWQNEFPQIFSVKEKYAYHVVLTTHNSRTSQRMQMLGIVKGKPAELNLKQEQALTIIFKDLIIENKYKCLAYNICKDHVHLILVCGQHELTNIVQKLKSVSSKLFNRWCVSVPPMGHDPLELENNDPMGHDPLKLENNDPMGHDPLKYNDPLQYNPTDHNNHLWSQKFFSANMDDWELMEISNKPGHVYKATYTQNAIEYIKNNRYKHHLPISDTLQKTIAQFVCTEDEAFANEYDGGFDVVIGNPPYVRQELFKEIKPYLEKEYTCYNSVADLYTYFIEKGIFILKPHGYFSYILPNKFLKATYGQEIRTTIQNNITVEKIYDFDDFPIFTDATTYPIIFVFTKGEKKKTFLFSEINKRINSHPIFELEKKQIEIQYSMIENPVEWNFNSTDISNIFIKINENSLPLSEIVKKKIYLGIKTGKNEAFIIENNIKDQLIKEDINSNEIIKLVATGKEIYRYRFNNSGKYLIFTQFDLDIKHKYFSIYNWLLKFENDLIKRGDKGKNWWNLRPCDYYDKIQQPKIIWRSITNECGFYLDSDGSLLLTNNNYFISSSSYSLLGILNSKLAFVYLKSICTTLQGGFFDFRRDKVMTVPIPKGFENIQLEEKVKFIQLLHLRFIESNTQFQKLLSSKFEALSINTKLEKWYTLSFADFSKELTKQKIKLSLAQQSEWLSFFEQEKQKALDIKNEIDKTDKEIDSMVYTLYGLTDEEIKIVEGA